jgi:hypothetical protein
MASSKSSLSGTGSSLLPNSEMLSRSCLVWKANEAASEVAVRMRETGGILGSIEGRGVAHIGHSA